MPSSHHAGRLNVAAFAAEGEPLAGTTPLQKMERLAQESIAPEAALVINWLANAELRAASVPEADVWLHLTASTTLPLTCQRCLTSVETPLQVDQWYRFVATEEIAMAEDDDCEEDLLVMEPQFDLLAVLEDELLMALPVVPMHEQCPTALPVQPAVPDFGRAEEKPNPFAALAQLKKK